MCKTYSKWHYSRLKRPPWLPARRWTIATASSVCPASSMPNTSRIWSDGSAYNGGAQPCESHGMWLTWLTCAIVACWDKNVQKSFGVLFDRGAVQPSSTRTALMLRFLKHILHMFCTVYIVDQTFCFRGFSVYFHFDSGLPTQAVVFYAQWI